MADKRSIAGGVVSLEYDASPVGPYREYVTMGSLVTKRGALGQWGSRLFVRLKGLRVQGLGQWESHLL